jgi:hypothetical protein
MKLLPALSLCSQIETLIRFAGTNKKNDLQYYLDRERNTGELHGQAPSGARPKP